MHLHENNQTVMYKKILILNIIVYRKEKYPFELRDIFPPIILVVRKPAALQIRPLSALGGFTPFELDHNYHHNYVTSLHFNLHPVDLASSFERNWSAWELLQGKKSKGSELRIR